MDDRKLKWRNIRGYTFNYTPDVNQTPTNECIGRFDIRGLLSICYHLYAGEDFDAERSRKGIIDELNFWFGNRRKIVIIEHQVSRQKEHRGETFVEVQIYIHWKELPSVERMLWFERLIHRNCIDLTTPKSEQNN